MEDLIIGYIFFGGLVMLSIILVDDMGYAPKSSGRKAWKNIVTLLLIIFFRPLIILGGFICGIIDSISNTNR